VIHFNIVHFYHVVLEVPGANSKSSNTGIIAGAAAGGAVLLLFLVLASVYAFRQKKKAKTATGKSNPFGKITKLYTQLLIL